MHNLKSCKLSSLDLTMKSVILQTAHHLIVVEACEILSKLDKFIRYGAVTNSVHVSFDRLLLPLFHTDHESQESINDRIHGKLNIFQPIRDVLRFSNEIGKKLLRIFIGYGCIRPESPLYCEECTTIYNNLFTNTAIN